MTIIPSAARLAVAIFLSIFVVVPTVQAQSATTGSDVIEEIVVTARYRSENLGKVPDSITAFTSADIAAQRI